jgi:hypothetical protein
MGAASGSELLWKLMRADEFGVKLEVVEGNYTWEFFPSPLHQGVVQSVQRSLRRTGLSDNSCDFFSIQDVYIAFPDGSLKRPDLSIYCETPELTRHALTVIPDAVVEVVSPGGDRKDLEIGPAFYLHHGVKDVVVINPEDRQVVHFRPGWQERFKSPATIELTCGCTLTA